jgi:DNA repair exonuclease SbcCD ATPase subunit
MEKVTFWGRELNEYEIANKCLSYATMAASFNAVLCNNITEIDPDIFCNIEGGEVYNIDGESYTEKEKEELIEKLEKQRDEIEEIIDNLNEDLDALTEELEDENTHAVHDAIEKGIEEKEKAIESREEQRDELEEKIEEAEDAESEIPEIFQWFIVEDSAKYILEKANEPLFYSEKLDCYVWGVTHYGTPWSAVLTSLELDDNFDLK